MRRLKWTLLILLTTGAALASWWLLPSWLANQEIKKHGTETQLLEVSPDKYALVINEYRKTFSQLLGGFGLVGTLLISVLTLRANDRAKVTERFGKALDHLGAVRGEGDKVASEVRIGAVSELEGVGEESPREQRMIRSSFIAYLRHYAYWGSAAAKKYEPAMWRMKEMQAMMAVLARWGFPSDLKDVLRLTDVDLRHLQLPTKADLANVIAARSRFDYAVLSGADFRNADLSQTVFRGAKLTGADFRGADLSESDFVGQDSTAAEDLWGWDYTVKHFAWGGHSSDAELEEANMWGVDLSSTRMTAEQYRSCKKNESTKPPTSLCEPSKRSI